MGSAPFRFGRESETDVHGASCRRFGLKHVASIRWQASGTGPRTVFPTLYIRDRGGVIEEEVLFRNHYS